VAVGCKQLWELKGLFTATKDITGKAQRLTDTFKQEEVTPISPINQRTTPPLAPDAHSHPLPSLQIDTRTGSSATGNLFAPDGKFLQTLLAPKPLSQGPTPYSCLRMPPQMTNKNALLEQSKLRHLLSQSEVAQMSYKVVTGNSLQDNFLDNDPLRNE
jgi:hypothetical protein